MSSPGITKNRGRTASDPAKAQAQKLLRTMCNFMLPLIQGVGRQKPIKPKKMHFGIEADEFIMELEKFISGIISRSQLRSQDVAIETAITLDRDAIDYLEGTSWLWELDELVLGDDAIADGGSDDSGNAGRLADYLDFESVSNQSTDVEVRVETELQYLRTYVTQKMPIRLLCFEPCNSKLKISLLERTGIYNYLATKLRSDPNMLFGNLIKDYGGYAILSHTWTQNPGELTYGDWQSGSTLNDKNSKCRKLVNFCKAAWEDHGITLGWIDTVCINKESSAELDESIRSMFAWYENAAICITYLEETDRLSDMRNDRWFTRGWTLQELIAPRRIKIYNKNWLQLSKRTAEQDDQVNDKKNYFILEEIRHATTITPSELQFIRWVSISRKMQLAATRQVTREEDSAYCLMGIFDVSISTAYGEGASRAFFRLVEEIFRSTKDVSDIFNWAGNGHFGSITSLFPSSPSSYLNCLTNESGPHSWHSWQPIEPMVLTHLGLRTPLLMMPAVQDRPSVSDLQPVGDYHASIQVNVPSVFLIYPEHYHLLAKGSSSPDGLINLRRGKVISLTIGTLNVEAEGSSIRIPKTCLSILLKQRWDEGAEAFLGGYEKLETTKPIVFALERDGENPGKDGDKPYYQIERSELAKHGMELVTLYL